MKRLRLSGMAAIISASKPFDLPGPRTPLERLRSRKAAVDGREKLCQVHLQGERGADREYPPLG